MVAVKRQEDDAEVMVCYSVQICNLFLLRLLRLDSFPDEISSRRLVLAFSE